MKIWILVTDDDYGLDSMLYTDKALAEADATTWVADRWGGDMPMPPWPEAMDQLSSEPFFLDRINIFEHEVPT